MSIRKRLDYLLVCVVFSLLLLGFFSLVIVINSKLQIQNIYTNNIITIEKINSINRELAEVNVIIPRLMSLSTNGKSAEEINKLGKEAVSKFKNATTALEQIIKEKKYVEDKSPELEDYLKNKEAYIKAYVELITRCAENNTYDATVAVDESIAKFQLINTFINKNTIAKQSDITKQVYIFAKKFSNITVFVVVGLLIFIITFLIIVISKTIAAIIKPLSVLQKSINYMSETGDYSKKIEHDSKDEFATVVNDINTLFGQINDIIKQINQVMKGVADGDFSKRLDTEVKGDLLDLKGHINKSLFQVNEAVIDILSVVKAVGEGDFSKRINSGAKGQLGEMCSSMNSMLKGLEESVSAISQVMKEMANNNLTGRIKVTFKGDLGNLIDNVNISLGSLSSSLSKISSHSNSIASATEQTSTAITQVSASSQKQATAIRTILEDIKSASSYIDRMHEGITEVQENAKESVGLVNSGQALINQLVEVVQNISGNSQQINQITDVISDIASQTNLLSLNAAIEAARAGESGKGFAVVADEVRKLAENSSSSAKEIGNLVNNAVQETERGVISVESVSNDMIKISKSVINSEQKMSIITQAIDKQRVLIKKIAGSIDDLMLIAEDNTSVAEEITASSEELVALSNQTMGEIKLFSLT